MLLGGLICRLPFFHEVTEHLPKQEGTQELNGLVRNLAYDYLGLQHVEYVVNCVQVHVKLVASGQVVAHLLQDHRDKPRTHFLDHSKQSFTGFLPRVQLLFSQAFDHDVIDQLL